MSSNIFFTLHSMIVDEVSKQRTNYREAISSTSMINTQSRSTSTVSAQVTDQDWSKIQPAESRTWRCMTGRDWFGVQAHEQSR